MEVKFFSELHDVTNHNNILLFIYSISFVQHQFKKSNMAEHLQHLICPFTYKILPPLAYVMIMMMIIITIIIIL
jgi:hypothetical protein